MASDLIECECRRSSSGLWVYWTEVLIRSLSRLLIHIIKMLSENLEAVGVKLIISPIFFLPKLSKRGHPNLFVYDCFPFISLIANVVHMVQQLSMVELTSLNFALLKSHIGHDKIVYTCLVEKTVLCFFNKRVTCCSTGWFVSICIAADNRNISWCYFQFGKSSFIFMKCNYVVSIKRMQRVS